jgi:hypothetical protein
MATNTYVALDKKTVGTAVAFVDFTSIPSGYTDLVLIAVPIGTAGNDCIVRVNSDTNTNYSNTFMYGSGSAAASGRNNNVSFLRGNITSMDSSEINTMIMSIQNYSNTTTFKTVLNKYTSTQTGKYVTASVGMWRSTDAINSITVTTIGTGNFAVGSTFSLYGIKSQEATAKATGGYVTSDANYYYHTFLASGTFTPKESITTDVLVVAGGGGGGGSGPGGGAGGLLTFTSQSLSATAYTCTIGSGGAAGYTAGQQGFRGVTGSDSQFGALTLVKGGGGAGGNDNSGQQDGLTGGSGGGGGSFGVTIGNGGSATSGQGNVGGVGATDNNTYRTVGGGGGAGAAGGNATSGGNGAGGVGATSELITAMGNATGTGQLVSSNRYFAGGSGASVAGYGGGGTQTVAGTANTGGGGGGSNFTSSATPTYGGAGGSGIIIIRYAKA